MKHLRLRLYDQVGREGDCVRIFVANKCAAAIRDMNSIFGLLGRATGMVRFACPNPRIRASGVDQESICDLE
jgi:hypothetical protein